MDKQKRNTKSKQLVMNILENSSSALCHEDIEGRLPEKMDRVTIYRILQGFCDDGKVHKITGENGKAYYALCHSCVAGHHHDNHLHFRCLKCNTVSCMDRPVVIPKLPRGYRLSDVTCLISGYCPRCLVRMKTLVVLLVFFVQGSLFAQHPVKVADRDTEQAIVGADIYFLDSKTGTTSDVNGIFSVNTKNSAVLVQISVMGYKTFLGTLTQDESTVYLEPSHFDLQEVVISGNSSKLQGENVANVVQLNLANNPETQGFSLSQKLEKMAGISNFSTGAGIGKPVIRGLSGNRVAVFSQGVRIENQQWGDEHGLGLDENGYGQVEIIKGPASLLYGSDALGGVLYFADERYAMENSIESVIGSEYNSNTNGWRNTGAFKLSKNRFHWNAFGGYTTHEDYADGNHNVVPNSRFHTGDFKTSLGYTGNKLISSLKYSFLNEQYGLTEIEDDSESVTNGRTPELPFQYLTTHILSSENMYFFDNNSKLKLNVGYVFNQRKEFEHDNGIAETEHAASLQMNLGTFSYDAKWYSPKLHGRWTFTVGSQGMYQINANKGEETLIPDATTADLGVFAVSDYYYSDRSYWQIGLRIDGRSIDSKELTESYAAFNFSTGMYQEWTKNLSFRANLSSGYRAPNMFELLSDGVHEGANRYELGNPTLKTENSYQIDVSLDYKNEHLSVFLNPYFNYIRNYIYLQPLGETRDEQPVYCYTQANAYLYGGETGFHFHPHPLDWLHLEGSYSNTFGERTGHPSTSLSNHQALPLMPSQKINATVRASFSGKKTLKNYSVYLQNQYAFAQNRVAEYETTTGAYDLVNAGLSFEFQFGQQKILFNAAVSNLFNTAYYDHLSRYKQDGIYNMGRNFNFRIRLPFGGSTGK
ncbi:MAG: TonB-dependent receptor [Bacteroidales bacterium]|jgi:iron complex outermembrane receptor protein|nr:TonB-dependent receptor [Bacteroidales bacterium]